MKCVLPLEINYRDHIGPKTLYSHCQQQPCRGPIAHNLNRSEPLVDFISVQDRGYGVGSSTRHIYVCCHGKSIIGYRLLLTIRISKPKVLMLSYPPGTHGKYVLLLEINYRDHTGFKTINSHCNQKVCQGPCAHHLSISEPLVDFTSVQARGYSMGSSTRHLYKVFFTT